MSTFKKMIPVIVLASSAMAPSLAMSASPWSVLKDSWSAADEKEYSDWVQRLGETKCRRVNDCLKSPANTLANEDEKATYKFTADCGRFPYLLRSYFAWKKKLPFSVVSGVTAAEGANGDLRYSKKGNVVTSRKDYIPMAAGEQLNGPETVRKIVDSVYTAMFRFHPSSDVNGKLFPDFYPVKITRENVRPGTVIYDPNGHVAVVYKVENDGRVLFFDAHPDNSVTRSSYGEKFARASPGMGAGFKNFRPIKLVGASQSNGMLYGGRVVTVENAKTPGYSIEQFVGTNPDTESWKKGKFLVNGQELPYYDFVRTRLAVGELKYHPVDEMKKGMETLCEDIQDRVHAVDGAIKANIHRKNQPSALPNNIYGTDGEWETYSTPSRDARLKTSFKELLTNVKTHVQLYRQGSPRVEYKGRDLVSDLRAAYNEAAKACVIEYKRSDNSTVRLDFDDVAQRLFKLSFDPYHCVELRWGASDTSELATCADGSTKRAWYEAEQRLRNQIERTYDAKMGFTLEQLRARASGSGEDHAPDVDVRGYLNSL